MREQGWTGGLEVLVYGDQYGVDGLRWVPVTRVSAGDASVYPIKVDFRHHGRGMGQYKVGEIVAARLYDLRGDIDTDALSEAVLM